jgi:hypothetical protein
MLTAVLTGGIFCHGSTTDHHPQGPDGAAHPPPVASGEFQGTKAALRELPPEEIADLLGYLGEDEVQNVFILLPVDKAASSSTKRHQLRASAAASCR